MISEDLKEWMMAEIHRQLAPMAEAVADVKRQNNTQTVILDKQASKLSDIDVWRRALWGNGSGQPGYLEIARAEDKAKYNHLLEVVRDLKSDDLRQEGKEQLLRELEEKRLKIEELEQSRKTHKLTRFHLWIGIAATLFGASLLTMIHPILHFLAALLTRLAG